MSRADIRPSKRESNLSADRSDQLSSWHVSEGVGINFPAIASAIGLLLIALAGMMLLPLLADLLSGETNVWAFTISIVLTLFPGSCLWMMGRGAAVQTLTIRDTFVLTTFAWIVSCLFATLPFVLSEEFANSQQGGVSFTVIAFEAVSGMTASGGTNLSGLDGLPRNIILWRSVMQWYGGIGIIVLALAILPKLQIGGMQLFRLESSDRSEKIAPRATELAIYISMVYLALSLACLVAYLLAGMSLFDAAVHMMTTVSTGGYSSHDASLSYFGSALIEWIAVVFMILGALPFGLYILFVRGNLQAFHSDPQVKWLIAAVLFFAAIIFFPVIGHSDSLGEGIRHALFTVVSLITTTGYSVTDYSNWGPFINMTLLIVSMLGACSGSTAGGLKTWRWIILFTSIRAHLLHLNYPRAKFPHRFGKRSVSEEVANAAFVFFFAYIGFLFLGAIVLMTMGHDMITAFSASTASIGNVGLALGENIGPAGNYSTISEPGRWVLIVQMILGRLEIMTILTLLLPSFWTR